MLNLTGGLVLVLLVQLPLVAEASYLIKLKNGNEFITTRYWQEGKQVLFDTYGGVFGVDRGFVTSIELSGKPVKIETVSAITEEEKVQPTATKESQDPAKPRESADPKKADDPIMMEFDGLKSQLKGLDGMLTSELLEYSNKITALEKKLQAEGKTNTYLREFGDLFEMGDAVEEVLKTRH